MRINKLELVLCILLFSLSAAILLTVYGKVGIGWDFTEHYLTGRTLINPLFWSQQLPLHIYTNMSEVLNATASTLQYYYIRPGQIFFPIYRDILAQLLLGISILAAGPSLAIPVYIIALLVLLLAASFLVAKEFEVNPLVLTALLFAPFVLHWLVLLNSTELLSLDLALMAVAMVARKSRLSGLLVGLAILTKYTNLILLPMLLLLRDPRKIAYAVLLAVLANVPYLVFNQIFLGNALLGAETGFANVSSNATVSASSLLGSFATIVAYPALVIIALLIHRFRSAMKDTPNLKAMVYTLYRRGIDSPRYQLALAISAIGFLELLLVFWKVGDPQRFGYLLYGGLALLGALLASPTRIKAVPYTTFGITVILLAALYLSALASPASWVDLGTKNPIILNAVSVIMSHNASGQIYLSNAWPALNYYGITAYVPTGCNATMLAYPIIVFKYFGTPSMCGHSVVPQNIAGNYSIYYPNLKG